MPICRRRRAVLSAAALVLAALAGCQKQGPGADATIKIGEYASLTGKEATFGQSSHNGTQLAIDAVNAAGGVLGKPLELLTEDDGSKQGQSATIIKKFIARDHVVAVLGEVASGRSLEAAPICQAERIPMVSPASTNPTVTQKGDYIFRVCFLDSFQGAAIAKFALGSLHLKRVGVLFCNSSPYSVGLVQYFSNRYVADGGQIAAQFAYQDGDKDFKAQLTAIKAANVDAIFVPGYYTEVSLICIQARELGLAIPLFGCDGWESQELIGVGGAAVDGCYFSTHYSATYPSPAVQDFVQRYRARYHGDTPDSMAALGYDSAAVLADAIRRAGSTEPAALRAALAATRGFVGVTGTTTIDPERNATKSAFIIKIEGGQMRFLEKIEP